MRRLVSIASGYLKLACRQLLWAWVCMSSCSAVDDTPVQIALSTQFPQAPIKLSKGTPLHLTVVDGRARKLIGYRGPTISGGEITAAGDITAVFLDSVSKGLFSLGFEIVKEAASAGTSLSVTLQNLEYWRGSNVVTSASVKVAVEKGRERVFEKIYTGVKEYGIFPPANASIIAERLNGAVQDLIWRIVADLELLQALQSDATAARAITSERRLARTIGGSSSDHDRIYLMAEIYKGMNIRFIVGFTPRTPADVHTRHLAESIQKYLPGSHSVVNMPGASSVIAANYLYNFAKPDGSTIGVFSGDAKLWKEMEAKGNLRADLRKFSWLGGLHNPSTDERYFFTAAPASPKDIVELLRAAFANVAADLAYRSTLAQSGMSFMTVAEVESAVADFDN